MGLDLLVDVPELRVPVRVPLALDRLGVALQAEPLGPQQITNGVGADPVALAGQLGRQEPRRMAWRVMTEKKHSTRLSQEQLVGVKCRVIRWFSGRASHLRTSWCLCVA